VATGSTPDGGRLPRLAYAHNPRTLAALDLVAAAEGICELVWIIDGSDEQARSMARLLRRLGPIVDRFGRRRRRGRDSNPRRTKPPETVFETAAFNRSATPPGGPLEARGSPRERQSRASWAARLRRDPPPQCRRESSGT
jgi:hypothetical protein